ncbi:L-rhamnose mutarotase [Streptomyces sp. NPDC020801]|uniref:L-rhamnose mutarotase n=1 Tax=unclassified Streptomyces TaxID=2593676 RepID=UPI0037AC0C42
MRIALHSRLHEGRELAYEAEHRAVPEELLAALRRAGISEWAIWRSGSDLFHVVECADFGAAMRELQEDPANQRWQETMKAYVASFAENPGGAADLGLRQVWTLTDQMTTDTE